MGRDNQPKERQRQKLERKQGRRASYDRILIVTEGSKTEPHYFREIRSTFRLPTTNVQVIHGSLGTAPIQIVDYAENLFLNGDSNRNIQPGAFEKVYAVFDRDSHQSYHDALRKIRSINLSHDNDAGEKAEFIAIPSIPCFELWLLFHYVRQVAQVNSQQVISQLGIHIQNYSKGQKGIFFKTQLLLNTATSNADYLRTNLGHTATSASPTQPFTDVDKLVAELVSLAR